MVLVTGATGLVGRHLVPILLGEGHRVRCLVRDELKARSILGDRPEFSLGDVRDFRSLSGSFSGIEAVVHLVAVIREKGTINYLSVNIEGTLNTVRAAERAGCSRFIHVSVLGVRDDPSHRYTYSKWRGEQIVRESCLNWTIFRPSLLYGQGFGFFDRMEQAAGLCPPPLAVIPLARTKFQPLAAEDLGRCIAATLKNPSSTRRVYEIGGPEQLTYGQMFDILMKRKNKRRFKIALPAQLMAPAVFVMERIFADPPVTLAELKHLFLDNTCDPASVEKLFGFKPCRLEQGLAGLTASLKK